MNSARIIWIDSIRGLAAFFVLIFHYFNLSLVALLPALLQDPSYVPQAGQNETWRDTLNIFQAHHIDMSAFSSIGNFILGYWDLGKIGVCLFFLVSGVVIPCSLARPEYPVRHFILSRFFRLYPIYWFSLTVILLLGASEVPINALRVIANYTMFQKFAGIPDINGVAWTLQIELIFYIACGVLFTLGLLKSRRANFAAIGLLWLAAVGLALVRLRLGIRAPIAVPLGLSLMFLGYLWRRWLLDNENIPAWQVLATGILFALVIFLVSFTGYRNAAWIYNNTYLIALGLFVLFTTAWRMAHPVLLFLGKISYSVYLLHGVIGGLLIPALVRLTPAIYVHHHALILLPILAALGCTLASSAATYYWIEAPCVRLGQQLARRLLPAKGPAAMVTTALPPKM